MPRKYSIAFLRARIAGDSAEIAVLSPKVETPNEPPPPAPAAPDLLARRAALVDELAAIDAAIEGERATLRQRLAALDLALHRPAQLPGEPKPRHAPPLAPGEVWAQQPEGHYAAQVAEIAAQVNEALAGEKPTIQPRMDPGPIPDSMRRDRAASET